MKNQRIKVITLAVSGALLLAGVFGVIGYQSVYAQAGTPTAAAGAEAAPAVVKPGGWMHGGYTDAELAEALGISTEDLTAAYTAANAEALKQAVEQGLLTQEQADQITASGRGFHGGRGFGGEIGYQALLADALGISEDELQAAITTVTNANLDEAVAAGSLTQEQADLVKGRNALAQDDGFQASMQSAYEAALAQAVSDGVITQAQANAILAQGSGWGKLGGFGGFGGPGMRGGHHGRGGFDFDGAPQPAPTGGTNGG